jgi:hydrogenase/urease accessory protein HupE
VYLISSLRPPFGFKKEHEMGLSPGFFHPLSYADLIALLTVGLLIHEVNVVLFLVLVSEFPESARFSMILIGKCTL